MVRGFKNQTAMVLLWMALQGTKLLFYDSHADVLLLDIPGAIPDSFHAWKLGFDAAAAVPKRALAIHHPVGNIKRISYANSSCGPLACFGSMNQQHQPACTSIQQ
jgi:hypothetical protein